MPLDNAKLERAVNTTEKLVKRMDALEVKSIIQKHGSRKDDYGHPVKSNNRVQQTDYGRGDADPDDEIRDIVAMLGKKNMDPDRKGKLEKRLAELRKSR